jgi:hypothetical protein
MQNYLTQVWHQLMGRWDGPFAFRFLIQPLMASFFAIRAGLRDARDARPPFGWSILTDADRRRDLMKEGWKDIARLFGIAVLVDVIYELVEFRWIYAGQAVIVALTVAVPPYLLIRGPTNRIARWWKARHKAPKGGAPPTSK